MGERIIGERLLQRAARESARRVSRDIPLHFTAQQRAFVEAVRDTRDHLVLRATAGAGKTTTLTEAAWHLTLTGKAQFFAYNKHSVQDVGPRLPLRVKASTLHGYGLGILCRARDQKVDPDSHKSDRLAQQLAREDGGRLDRRQQRALVRAWDLAREYGLDEHAHEDDLIGLMTDAEWPGSLGLQGLVRSLRAMRQASLADWRNGGLPDFTDMLWLPLALGLEGKSLAVALIDECQDLTPLRQAFLMHLLGLDRQGSVSAGRLIAVGDPDQAIYTYAGADPRAMWRLATRIGAKELPLSVSFRCPARHVALAQTVSSFIESAPGAIEGTVEHVEAEKLTVAPGDVLIARLNAPLVRVALLLMSQNVSVHIRGRDLATRLEAAINETFPLSFREDDVKEQVNAYYERRAEPLVKRVREGDDGVKKVLTELADIAQCLRLLGRHVALKSASGVGSVSDLKALLLGLYREDADITLSTVHRMKGLEAESVTVLYPELMPSPTGDPQEERCVQFVALTRSKDRLRFAYGKEAWASGWRMRAKGEPQEALPEVPVAALLEEPETPAPAPVEQLVVRPKRTRTSKATPPPPAPPTPAPPKRLRSLDVHLVTDGPPPSIPKLTRERWYDERVTTAVRSVWDLSEALATPNPTSGPAAPAPLPPGALQLFGGPDDIDVQTLRERLEALQDEPRIALSEWAGSALVQLRSISTPTTGIFSPALEAVERAALLERTAAPLTLRTDKIVLVMEFDEARTKGSWRLGSVAHRGDRVISLKVGTETLQVDARTGELIGQPFQPFALHARLA